MSGQKRCPCSKFMAAKDSQPWCCLCQSSDPPPRTVVSAVSPRHLSPAVSALNGILKCGLGGRRNVKLTRGNHLPALPSVLHARHTVTFARSILGPPLLQPCRQRRRKLLPPRTSLGPRVHSHRLAPIQPSSQSRWRSLRIFCPTSWTGK